MNKLVTLFSTVIATAKALHSRTVVSLIATALTTAILLGTASALSTADGTLALFVLAMAYAIIPTGGYVAIMLERDERVRGV